NVHLTSEGQNMIFHFLTLVPTSLIKRVIPGTPLRHSRAGGNLQPWTRNGYHTGFPLSRE
ncbi:MAG: hypothetical protein KC940_26305, partial [Candidatus Omnitrophica bacterium]|nr:hypothetical protein [Candidatus Omnitrophota bacterium]